MARFWSAALVLGLLTAPATAWDRGDVDVLAVLPDVTPGVPSSVEGLTVGPDDNIYAPTFGFNATGAIAGPVTFHFQRLAAAPLTRKSALRDKVRIAWLSAMSARSEAFSAAQKRLESTS